VKKISEIGMSLYITFCIYALIGWLYEVFWMWFVVPPYHFVNRGVLFLPFLPIYGFGMLILLFCLRKFMKKKHPLENPIYRTISLVTITTFIYTTIIEYTTPKIYHVSDYLKGYGLGLLIANIIVLIGFHFLVKKSKKLQKLDTTIILVFLAIWIITTVIEYISHFVTDKFLHQMLWDYAKDFLNINRRVNWDASRNFAIGGTFLLYVVQPFVDKLNQKLTFKNKLIITLGIGIPMLIDAIIQ